MTTQRFSRIYDYIHEFQRLVYDYYSKDLVAYLVTYYHINVSETIWDDEDLLAGSYDRVGEYSGVRWDKILLLPVYFVEEINTAFDARDIGYIKEGETNFVIPSTYNFTPLPNDKLKLEQSYLRPTNNTYPIFNVTGVEKSVNADRLFWRVKVRYEQSVTETQLDQQVVRTFSFFDYDKKIYALEDAQFLAHLLANNEELRDTIGKFYEDNSGFYFPS